MRIAPLSLKSIAPRLIGALFWLWLVPGLTSCGRSETPEWDQPGDETPPAALITDPAAVAPGDEASARPSVQSEVAAHATDGDATASLRFIAYNVENWLTMDRYEDGQSAKNAPKPDDQKKAVISILSRNHPDVLGLCEIGTAGDLAEIQELLKADGCDLPHVHYTSGSDPVRRLGLLSRFPITSTARPENTSFRMNGAEHSINRGILDATITANAKPYRFIGVHFKSKRDVKEYDQEQFRINEARLLRQHVDSILARDANARLIVYGDFNDTRPTSSFRTVTGGYNSPGYLTAIPAKDRSGHAWTHHWRPHDIYSRIDFVTVSRALRSEVDFRSSRIIDDADWDKASDHRPILALFR
jgi:endonuclease/exonuclease/phosphatase family metal-dependent hydrolase